LPDHDRSCRPFGALVGHVSARAGGGVSRLDRPSHHPLPLPVPGPRPTWAGVASRRAQSSIPDLPAASPPQRVWYI